MSLSSLNLIQDTIADLRQIVDRNQGAHHEAALLVKQMEQLVAEMEHKARSKSGGAETLLHPALINIYQPSI
jgi:hypothetical protein